MPIKPNQKVFLKSQKRYLRDMYQDKLKSPPITPPHIWTLGFNSLPYNSKPLYQAILKNLSNQRIVSGTQQP